MKNFTKSLNHKLFVTFSDIKVTFKPGKNAIKLYSLLIGFLALLWFLIRVIPKPHRASYPCQRAAFPIASAFVIWISGTFFSKGIMRKAYKSLKAKYFLQSFVLGVLAIVVFLVSVFFIQIQHSTVNAIDYISLQNRAKVLREHQMSKSNSDIVEPIATVSIVKSTKENASDITQDDIDTMVRRAVKMAGGFDSLIHEGDSVVLKPNLISSRVQNAAVSQTFPQEVNGIATDYRMVQAVVNLVRTKNASGKVFLIEGSGYGVTRTNANAMGYDKITGLDSIIYLDEFLGSWYDKNSPDIVKVSLPSGKNIYSSDNVYYLNKIYHNAKVLISLPCLKTHFLTGITGAVKNVGIGATPVQIYGNGTSVALDDRDGRWNHIDHGDFSTYATPLHKWIHDFYLCRPVDYAIMDGLQGAQYGPYPGSSGDSYQLKDVQMNMRVILAGKDAVAVDAIESLIEGFDPYLIGYLQYLAEDSAGCINPARIKVVGTQVHEIKERFNEHAPGNKGEYNNFEAPAVRVPEPGTILDSTLNVSLSVPDDVIKVEFVYDDTVLPCMVIGNFSAISFPLKSYQTDISKVNVMVYDRYLNCSKFCPDHIITSIQQKNPEKINLFPNPATDHIVLELQSVDNQTMNFQILTANGKIICSRQVGSSAGGEYQIDISSLQDGLYFIKGFSGQKQYSASFIKCNN